MTHDLTTVEGFRAYLFDPKTPTQGRYAPTPDADSVTLLVGGSSAFAYRIRLSKPMDATGEATVVAKHIEGYAAKAKDWKFGQERLNFEVEALEAIGNAPFIANTVMQVPRVLLHDKPNHTVFLSDCGSLPTIKEFIADSSVSPELCHQIGAAVGEFLASMHAWSRNEHELLNRFSNNEPGTFISVNYHFGRLILSAEQLKLYDSSAPDQEWFRTLAEQYNDEIKSKQGPVLTNGDFWTGNMLIDSQPNSNHLRIWALDWELCKRGPAYFDIGAFLAECHCLSYFRQEGSATAASSLTTSFLNAYRDQARKDGLDVEPEKVAVKTGNHLVVVMPIVGWSEDESKIHELASAGMNLIEIGWTKKGLEKTLVKDLL